MTWLLRLILLLAGAVAGVVALAPPAAAHPTLVATLPEAGYSVTTPVEEIGLVFDERVTVNELVVEGQARGDVRTSDPRVSADGTRVVVRPLTPLPRGRYTVRWQITALDGDVVDGVFGFGVGAAAGAAADPLASETSGQGAAALLRWALFTSLALALGGLVGDALARRRVRHAGTDQPLVAPRPWLLPATLLGVAASLGLALHSLGGGSLMDGLGDASVAAVLDARAGRLIAGELAAFAVATVAALRPYRWLLVLALAFVVVAEGLRSHLQTEAPPWGSITIVVHLAAAAIWVGALIHVIRTALRWRHRPGQARALFLEYTWMALLLYGAVVTTGTVAAVLALPTLDALWSTTYGQVLLAKLALVAVVSGLAVAARRRLRRPRSGPAALRLTRIEWPVLVTVLAVSAVLTAVAPPADPSRGLAYPPPAAGGTVRLGTLAGQITTGVVASEGQLELRLRVPEWDPNASHHFEVTGTLTGPGQDRTRLRLEPCGAGCFVGQVRWAVGPNRLELDVRAADWSGAAVTFDVPWPAQGGGALFDQMLATMARQPHVTFVESVTSDTTGQTPFQSEELQINGPEFIDLQPYRSGVVDGLTVLRQSDDTTEIGFAISAEGIYVRQTLGADGRLVHETVVSPNHLIERTYTYR